MLDLTIRNWQDLAAVVTVFGVVIGLVGLYFGYQQLRRQAAIEQAQSDLQAAAFEDGFVREYRQLVQRIPTKALLGETLTPTQRSDALSEFYHYVDLCNEQAYQADQGRIRNNTWTEWATGIRGNLRRPEFLLAWSYIAAKSSGEFQNLRNVVPPLEYDPSSGYPPPESVAPKVDE